VDTVLAKSSRWQAAFHALPPELHTNIMAHLDPVSQMCLGLTSSYFLTILCSIYGSGKKYNIRRNPFDLRMQVSVCGEYFLNYVYEDWFLRDCQDIIWERNLGELLWEEKTLWGNLRCCESCLRYKPEEAYGRFEFEEEVFRKYKKEIEAFEAEDVGWYESRCRRCRAKILLVIFERGREVFEDLVVLSDRESLGLTKEKMTDGERCQALEDARTAEQYHAAQFNYESWDSIFRRLNI
jgi:hypothetical protein